VHPPSPSTGRGFRRQQALGGHDVSGAEIDGQPGESAEVDQAPRSRGRGQLQIGKRLEQRAQRRGALGGTAGRPTATASERRAVCGFESLDI